MTDDRQWYRGENCNFFPSKEQNTESDALDKYYLNGWTPSNPIIHKDTMVTTFGSCFAALLRRYLEKRKVKQHQIKYKEIPIVYAAAGLNTTFTLRQQFEWAWENRKFDEVLWFTDQKEKVLVLEKHRDLTKEVFNQTDVFVITLGLSEVWYNKVTGDTFWRAIPKSQFDPNIHGFRISTVQENIDNLIKILKLGEVHNPNAKWIFTLSPVALKATFRPVGAVTANAVSKAILRAAVDETIRNVDKGFFRLNENLFYWPSYEIAKEYMPDAYRDDNLHVNNRTINTIMKCFDRYFISKELR